MPAHGGRNAVLPIPERHDHNGFCPRKFLFRVCKFSEAFVLPSRLGKMLHAFFELSFIPAHHLHGNHAAFVIAELNGLFCDLCCIYRHKGILLLRFDSPGFFRVTIHTLRHITRSQEQTEPLHSPLHSTGCFYGLWRGWHVPPPPAFSSALRCLPDIFR